MKIVIFSDVHGNLPALELMLKHSDMPDAYICLGDMVNYAPWSNECVEVICGLSNCIILKGNHEDYFLTKQYNGTNIVSKTFFDFCLPSFKQEKLITNLLEIYTFNNYTYIHTILDKNIYPDTPVILECNYVIGHSHHQFMTTNNGYSLYNTGSVGQNRKYINVINYIELNTKTHIFEFKQIVYDDKIVIDKMCALKYPQICIDYYKNKQRI